MPTISLRRLKLFTLGLVSVLALRAQVDSNLATATDILDVYKSGSVKPEIITMFDFSGSMSAVFWHYKFWTNANYNTHLTAITNGDNDDQCFTVDTTNNAVTITPYTGNTSTTLEPITGFLVDYNGNKLVAPLTLATLRTATHARLTWTRSFSSVSYTRTIDIPFPWTIHKDPSVVPTSNNLGNPAFIDGVQDPDLGSTNNYIAFDTAYATYSNMASLVSAIINTGDPLMKYNTDYLYWIFWGTDTKGASGNDNTGGATGVFTDDNGKSLSTGKFIIPGSATSSGNIKAFANGLPTGTRASTLKKAVLASWFGNRDRVWWAYRFLDSSETGTDHVKSTNYGTWGTHTNRELTLLKASLTVGVTDNSISNIQIRKPSGGTPLTAAMANCLAQMVETGGTSIFDQSSTKLAIPPGETPPPCRSSWVILFTDGVANESPMPKAGGGAWTTEAGIRADLNPLTYSNLNSGGSNWNIWSLAAVAAHGTGTATTTSNSAGTSASAFAPFRVTGRNANPTRPITTMTVGLCLAGTPGDINGGKGPLLKAALFGDSTTGGYDISTAVAYGVTTGGAQTNFFDATSPGKLVTALNTIMARVVSGNAGITAPSAPLVGLSLGTRAFLGRFQTSNDKQGGGSIWKGDLLMAGLGIDPADGSVGLKDSYGNFVSDINANNAVASAYNALYLGTYPWAGRKIYTVIPGSEPALGGSPLDLTAPDQQFSESNTKLTNLVMGTPDYPTAVKLIRFLQGAGPLAQSDLAGVPASAAAHTATTKKDKRSDIMGDIVNSSPAAVEFDASLLQGTLKTEWDASYASGKSYATDARFHVVFVGDNQGLFHAFGVVSGLATGTPAVLHAKMEELWAFVPSEFLNIPTIGSVVPKLSLLQSGDPTLHIYTVDGSPVIYFNDSPISGVVGNFKVDKGITTGTVTSDPDTVRVIVGLRKGGRSYYSFDVLDPYKPKLAWVVNPNTSADATIKSMGLATSSIGLAEVDDPSSSTGYKDLVILGGGYSDNTLDSRSIAGNPAVKLGRSLLALNVLTGAIVKKYDFQNNPTLKMDFPDMGAIAAGGFPFQFFAGSGRTQRVYFGDQSGGVYALGSMKKLTTSAVGWRSDSSNIDSWTSDGSTDLAGTLIPNKPGVRWIYKGATTIAAGLITAAAPITSAPVAFRLPRSIPELRRPSTSTNAANMNPPVVGVTFGTGDRNDPMDQDTTNPVASASLRQVMVFDRQDSDDLPSPFPKSVDTYAGAITDSLLSDQTGTAVVGTTSYLSPFGTNQYLGYYLNLGTPKDDPNSNTTPKKKLYPKAYLSPLAINGGLVFSSFIPETTGSATSCAGSGTTKTYRMCDALAPVFANGAASTSNDRSSASCSGLVFTWSNLAGDLTAVGSRLILQSGQDPGAAGTDKTGNIKIGSYSMPGGTTAFAPRSWRIIR